MNQTLKLQQYYQWHSKIYDATRWSFLFGRNRLMRLLDQRDSPRRILEVGCGTGHNLIKMAEMFPDADITGLDLSSEMLSVARRKFNGSARRFTLLHQPLQTLQTQGHYDLVVFSYTLSMINPFPEEAVAKSRDVLKDGGMVAVTDFQFSEFRWFRRWMAQNHVAMENHLRPLLSKYFQREYFQEKNAYGGLWSYFLFLGRRSA